MALLFLLSCFLLAALSGCAYYKANGSETQALVISSNSVVFGNVAVGKVATATVSLLNESPAAV